MPNAKQIRFLQTIKLGFVSDPDRHGNRNEKLRNLNWLGERGEYFHISHNTTTGITTAFSKDAHHALIRLAHLFRSQDVALAKISFYENFLEWFVKNASSALLEHPTINIDDLSDKIECSIASYKTQNSHHCTHLVPCSIIRDQIPSFNVGLVRFFHRDDYDLILPHFQNKDRNEVRDAIFSNLDKHDAHWIAEISLSGYDLSKSIALADIIVDIGISAIKIVFGYQNATRRFCRTTGRTYPPQKIRAPICDNLAFTHSAWDQLGFSISGSAFSKHLLQEIELIDAIGDIISEYIMNDGELSLLTEAWCGAAYWYHEAIMEEIPSIGVVKMETAIEILFCAESSKQSNARLIKAFEVFYRLEKHDFINGNSEVTVSQFVSAIVSSRSRVLHGNLSTFTADLVRAGDDLPITFADVEAIARVFIIEYALMLSSYQSNFDATDNIDAYLKFICSTGQPRHHDSADRGQGSGQLA